MIRLRRHVDVAAAVAPRLYARLYSLVFARPDFASLSPSVSICLSVHLSFFLSFLSFVLSVCPCVSSFRPVSSRLVYIYTWARTHARTHARTFVRTYEDCELPSPAHRRRPWLAVQHSRMPCRDCAYPFMYSYVGRFVRGVICECRARCTVRSVRISSEMVWDCSLGSSAWLACQSDGARARRRASAVRCWSSSDRS